ncbi:hypothetical protein FRC03_011888 [Tulasnella sp. 419]|nr:hypothetical protein FRC03_011888 [Tulasnella sp. 419]
MWLQVTKENVFYTALGEGTLTILTFILQCEDQAVVDLAKKLKVAGVPIHGIGHQTHLSANIAGGVRVRWAKMVFYQPTKCYNEYDMNLDCFDIVGLCGRTDAVTEPDIAEASAADYTTVIKACLIRQLVWELQFGAVQTGSHGEVHGPRFFLTRPAEPSLPTTQSSTSCKANMPMKATVDSEETGKGGNK